MKQILFFITFFTLTIFSSNANEYSLSSENNMPRNGDKPTYHVVEFINFNDTSNMWDYSTAKISDVVIANKYSISGDTLISRFNGEISTSRIINNSILCMKTASQGKVLYYNRAELTKRFPITENSGFNGSFYNEGTIDHGRYLRQLGTTSTFVKKGQLITPEGDSLQNVLLVKTIRNGSSIIENDYCNSFHLRNDSSMLSNDSIMWHLENDSITFNQEINQWYVRGYRYPVIETRKVKTFFFDIPSDSISIAYYSSPNSQIFDLASDPDNEKLRDENEAASFRNSFSDIANTKSHSSLPSESLSQNNADDIASSLTDDETCNINHSESSNNITISYSVQPESIVAITLHNSAGALMWQTKEVAYDSQGNISYPTHHLVAGEYLVTIFLKKSQYSFKFIKK